jgi:hypothetical protein
MAAKADPHRFDDLLAQFGRIVLRRMFGGEGIFALPSAKRGSPARRAQAVALAKPKKKK